MADDTQGWAKHTGEIHGAAKHLEGRKLTGPQQGFGPLWQKTYTVEIPGHSPQQVIAEWKAHYGEFWPSHSKFNAPIAGIKPGEVGTISTMQALSTGIMVMYADDTSFAFMTPEGHPFAGWITFSATGDDDWAIAQVQLLIRPNDPIWDVGFMLGMAKGEDVMWRGVLRKLARHLGSDHDPQQELIKVDNKRIWANAKNWTKNAMIPRRRKAAPAPPTA
jgi:hypothetical protein